MGVQKEQRGRRWVATRVLVALSLYALIGVRPADGAKPIWDLGERALVKKTAGYLQQPGVAQLYKDASRSERRGMKKLLVAAGHAPNARLKPKLPYGLGNGLARFKVFITPAARAEATVKGFLKDVDTLYDWARRADDALEAAGQARRHVADLGELAVKLGNKNAKDWKGAWYEIRLAAKYANEAPPRLQRIQPSALDDVQPFRDAGIAFDPVGSPDLKAWIEAKNWPEMSVANGRKSLQKQVDSHFRRLVQRQHLVGLPLDAAGLPRFPPGVKLIYDFNGRLPDQWAAAIRSQARRSLETHFGVSPEAAARWVEQHLIVRRTDLY